MPVQFDPPVQLDPSQDLGHQLAFINQNFLTIAGVLSKNSFLIYRSDTYTFPAISGLAANTEQVQQFSVNHSLGLIPAYNVYAQIPKSTESGMAGFPSTFYTVVESRSGFQDSTDPQMFNTFFIGINETSLFVNRIAANGDFVDPHDASAVTIRYYIQQQTAN